MGDYRPSLPFTVPAYIFIPTKEIVKGVTVKSYPAEGVLIYCSFKTYGGTEQNKDGVYSVIDTANVETWFRPDIKADCRFKLAEYPDKVYEIMGEPENINMRNQFMKFKVKAVAGGA
jgi:hypothetical protein